MSERISGQMRVLMVMNYKSCPVYVRMIGKSMFMWDVISNNQLYSSYIIMKPAKGRQRLLKKEIEEVTKMCFAGAAATVDNLLGIELPKDTQEQVDIFLKATRNLQTNKGVN